MTAPPPGPPPKSPPDIAAVVIGRNEGGRLRRCLVSLSAQVGRLVYVDSGSTDGSVALARSLGATVVELDPAQPFTAARARNAGFAALDPPPWAVQFVDGDCTVEPGWIAAAAQALADDPAVALVTGWRTEVDPWANAFHAMVEVEWHRPSGPIRSCGGDMMVRAGVFRALGGLDADIIASEDEDFVLRLRKAGHGALRLARVMTRHDIAMARLGPWWRRNLRSGHGLAEVGDRHPPHFRPERRRAVLYGLVLPLVALAGLASGHWWLALAVLAAYGLSIWRVRRYLGGPFLDGRPVPARLRLPVACLFTLAKLPHLLGMLWFRLRRLRRQRPRIIEYK